MNKVEKKKIRLFSFRKTGIVLLPIIAIIIAIMVIVPKINLSGKRIVEVGYKSEYTEKGATATFMGNDISKDLSVKGKVNTSKLGEYKITYSLKNTIFKKSRVVKVVDNQKPKLTLNGDKSTYACPGTKYSDEGATAVDDYDGDITKNIKSIFNEEDNTYTYEIIDSSKNKSKKVRKVLYEDKTNPTIELKGNKETYVNLGSAYNEPGYVANDNCDGDISESVTVEGSVDINTAATYELKYTATDKAGNSVSDTRKVIVSKFTNPDSGYSKPGVIYLTFDDGPQEGTTNVILDILRDEGVKATFFVTNKGPDYLIKREYDEGHQVALHTASHDYSIVYSSDEAYFNDLNSVHDRVLNITGYDSRIIRFPGGSSNTVSRHYSQGIMSRITQEALNRGYRYYDWNISSGDAGETTSPSGVYSNVVNNLRHDRSNMILMHDIKWYTRDALRDIIRYGKENGYQFEAISMDTAMVRQRVNN